MIVAIVQARLGSTRLPGKTLMDICGKPMLDHVLDRLAKCETLDKVVVATTTAPRDDPIVTHCHARGTSAHRGPEEDVLTRYLMAAEAEHADVVVRVTSDCPCVDAQLVDNAVQAFGATQADYLTLGDIGEGRSYPRGFDTEVVAVKALQRIQASNPTHRQREHVTLGIYESTAFRLETINSPFRMDNLRLTVDTDEDLDVVRRIFNDLGENFNYADVRHLHQAAPSWLGLNQGVAQKQP